MSKDVAPGRPEAPEVAWDVRFSLAPDGFLVIETRSRFAIQWDRAVIPFDVAKIMLAQVLLSEASAAGMQTAQAPRAN